MDPIPLTQEVTTDLDTLRVFRFRARVRLLADRAIFRAPVAIFCDGRIVGFASIFGDNQGRADDLPFVTLDVHGGMRYDDPLRLDLETESAQFQVVPLLLRDRDGLMETHLEIVRDPNQPPGIEVL